MFALCDGSHLQSVSVSQVCPLLRIFFGLYIFPLSDLLLTNAAIQMMTRAQSSHPLDPLSAAEIAVAVATVRAAGATPEVMDD